MADIQRSKPHYTMGEYFRCIVFNVLYYINWFRSVPPSNYCCLMSIQLMTRSQPWLESQPVHWIFFSLTKTFTKTALAGKLCVWSNHVKQICSWDQGLQFLFTPWIARSRPILAKNIVGMSVLYCPHVRYITKLKNWSLVSGHHTSFSTALYTTVTGDCTRATSGQLQLFTGNSQMGQGSHKWSEGRPEPQSYWEGGLSLVKQVTWPHWPMGVVWKCDREIQKPDYW